MVCGEDFKNSHPWAREDSGNGFTFLKIREHFRDILGSRDDGISTVNDIPDLMQLGVKGEFDLPYMWGVENQCGTFQDDPAQDPILDRLIRSSPKNFEVMFTIIFVGHLNGDGVLILETLSIRNFSFTFKCIVWDP